MEAKTAMHPRVNPNSIAWRGLHASKKVLIGLSHSVKSTAPPYLTASIGTLALNNVCNFSKTT